MTDINMIITEYESLAALMKQMLEAARLQDWEKVSDLELFYQDKMAQIKLAESNATLSKNDQGRKLDIIKLILEDDNEIKGLIYPKMDELSKFISGSYTKNKLNRAYGM
jgi:flagellar protein FliT